MNAKINNSTNPHPTQPYFLPATVIPLTAFHPAPKPAQPRMVLPWVVAVIWDALYLGGKERAAEEATK